MARPSNKEERRTQIVEGFQVALAAYGYEKATIALIAKSAGLTAGLIHYHFRSKLEILLELVDRLGARLHDRYLVLSEGRRTPEGKLAAFIDSRLATGEGADPAAVACWVAIGTEALRQPEVRQVYSALMTAQHAELLSILQEIRGTSVTPLEAAAAILASIEGCYQLAATVPSLVPPGSAAGAVRQMAEGLLSCKLPS